MAELSAEAPLAKSEADDEWVDYAEFQSSQQDVQNSNCDITSSKKPAIFQKEKLDNCKENGTSDNFIEIPSLSGSLEDLVNTFDDKITKCFKDMDQNVETLAPVQIRNQDEVISECPMWWTLTGNYGNILPIDWSQTTARKLQLSALNLNNRRADGGEDVDNLSDEDDSVANDLDMHALILSGLQIDADQEPVKTAEEILREIEDIMEETNSTDALESMQESPDSPQTWQTKRVLPSPLYESKLQVMSVAQLNELLMEFEMSVQEHSETLIAELALRDELEFEKELKNSFISLLLSVQNRRRQFNTERKKIGVVKNSVNGTGPKYLTTVIPYDTDAGPASNQTLQVLIKILKAIHEDSPTVPALLTDYILKVLCPT